MAVSVGDIICARGRPWIAVTAPDNEIDMFVADPFFTDAERKQIERVDKVNEAKKTVIPSGVYIQRSVLEVSELQATP